MDQRHERQHGCDLGSAKLLIYCRAADRRKRLCRQQGPVRLRFFDRGKTDGDIDVVERQVDEALRGIDRDSKAGTLRGKQREPWQQNPVSECGGARDRQRSSRFAPGQLLRRLGEHAERLVDHRRVAFSGIGQLQAARSAMKQLNAEPILQCLDAVADCARREIEFIGRLAEAVVAGGGLEHTKRAERWKPKCHALNRCDP